MAKVCTPYILRLLWKTVENMFFQESEQIGMGGRLLPKFITSTECSETSSSGGEFP